MASGKEIRTKISSVKNTQKITRAMEMVAGSKMRKAQAQMERGRPYAEKIQQVIGHLANANPEYRHKYMEVRDIKRVGVIVISSDRGLCGGLNTNLFRRAIGQMKQWGVENKEIDVCVIGNKARQFFKRIKDINLVAEKSHLGDSPNKWIKHINLVAEKSHLGDSPDIGDIIGAVDVMLEAYIGQRIDQLVLFYNRFVNTMSQKPMMTPLFPLEPANKEEMKHHWDYLYEPDSKQVVDTLMIRYVESRVYQSVLENIACEQSARMVAMKSASDNVGSLIDELQLDYNKARQAAITQELSEIVSGAAAV